MSSNCTCLVSHAGPCAGLRVPVGHISFGAKQEDGRRFEGKVFVAEHAKPRDHLTLTEALEALRDGKKVRADEMSGTAETSDYWYSDGNHIMWKTRAGDLGGLVNVRLDHSRWHFHIIDDKPKKSRVAEMAEAAYKAWAKSSKSTRGDFEELGRKAVEAVIEHMDKGTCPHDHSADLRRTFLEPR